MADWTEHLWQILPSVIAAVVAVWQFSGLRDHRRAQEMVVLNEAIAAAKKRRDPLEHAYRAHALSRMQALHGNPQRAFSNTLFSGLFLLMTFLLVISARTADFAIQATVLLGFVAAFALFARALGIFFYNIRTKHGPTAEAMDQALASARQDFIDHTRKLPTLRRNPDLAEEVRQRWRKMNRDQRRYWVVVVIFIIAFFAFADWVGTQLIHREVRRVEMIDSVSRLVVVCLAIFGLLNPMLRHLAVKFQQKALQWGLFWGGQAAWIAATFVWTGPWVREWLGKISDETPLHKDFGYPIAAFAITSLCLAWANLDLLYVRFRRRRKAA